jgi:hypothetical protein
MVPGRLSGPDSVSFSGWVRVVDSGNSACDTACTVRMDVLKKRSPFQRAILMGLVEGRCDVIPPRTYHPVEVPSDSHCPVHTPNSTTTYSQTILLESVVCKITISLASVLCQTPSTSTMGIASRSLLSAILLALACSSLQGRLTDRHYIIRTKSLQRRPPHTHARMQAAAAAAAAAAWRDVRPQPTPFGGKR